MGLAELKKEKDNNDKQRLEWIDYWVGYMKKNTNEVWSKQQANFINSVMRSADVDVETYMKVKKIVKGKALD